MSDSEESSSSHDHDVGLQLHHESDPDGFSSSSDEDSEDQYCDHVDISKYHFCPDHKAGSMKKDCATCSAALSVISDPELVNRLLSITDTKAVNLERYKVRCDDVEQTMFLSPSIVELAKETFNGGKFRDRKVWKYLVKKYLTISHSDHLKLTEDISTEDVFDKFHWDKKYNYIFKFMSDMKDAMKDLRLAQRLLFSSIQNLSTDMTDLRKFGEDIGIVFPESAPARKGANVPRTGGKVPDLLDYESYENIFPCPDLVQFVEDSQLSDNESELLEKIFGKYREGVVKTFMAMFKTQATALTSYDDNLYNNFLSLGLQSC